MGQRIGQTLTPMNRFDWAIIRPQEAAGGGGPNPDQSGRLVASVKGLMDEAFLDGLREKTRRGMLGQVRRGFSAGGHPYGYRSESTPGGGAASYVLKKQTLSGGFSRCMRAAGRRVRSPKG